MRGTHPKPEGKHDERLLALLQPQIMGYVRPPVAVLHHHLLEGVPLDVRTQHAQATRRAVHDPTDARGLSTRGQCRHEQLRQQVVAKEVPLHLAIEPIL